MLHFTQLHLATRVTPQSTDLRQPPQNEVFSQIRLVAKGICPQALSRVLRSQAHVDGRICRLGRGEHLNTALTMK